MGTEYILIMVIIMEVIKFKKFRYTKGFEVYKSTDFDDIGDFTNIYVRKNTELSKKDILVLISLDEYVELKSK